MGGGDGAVVVLAGTGVVWNTGTKTLIPDGVIAGVGDGNVVAVVLAGAS
jgi:hypothetical protein